MNFDEKKYYDMVSNHDGYTLAHIMWSKDKRIEKLLTEVKAVKQNFACAEEETKDIIFITRSVENTEEGSINNRRVHTLWLNFKTKGGKHAAINLNELRTTKKGITAATMKWAIKQFINICKSKER